MKRFDPWRHGPGISVVVGHYGSGKTEFALKLAIMAAASGMQSTIVDLDIVNPFFRSAEKSDYLKSSRVDIIAPPYALTGVDLPVLSAEVDAVFEREGARVFDVGGDDAGAAALGRFKPRFEGRKCDVYFIVNAFRPFSSTPERVIDLMCRIQARSRLNVTGLVNNSNLGDETTLDDVLSGQELLDRVSRETGIQTACVCCLEHLAQRLPSGLPPVLTIDRLLKPDWML